MKLFSELQKITKLLNNYPNQWAICGGIAASIYRETARYTDDIDIALINSDNLSAKDLASKIISELGYKEYEGFIPDPFTPNKQLKALLCAKNDNERFTGFDFLLPVQFWIPEAVKLAQENKIDYGFSSLATITPESLIFAKLIALNSNPNRYQDIDDIKAIIKSNKINFDYIQQQITKSKIDFKPDVLKTIPNTIP